MKILKIDDDQEMDLTEAVKVLKSGGIIAYPTDTFYALGVNAKDKKALKRLYSLKGRSLKKPLPVIIWDKKALKPLVRRIPPEAKRLMERFWPGPLTIVFEASSKTPELLTARTGKIAVRVPGERIALRLARESGFPITSTSANPSGRAPATGSKKVIKYFDDRIDLIIDGGKTPGGKPSTIVDVTDNVRILREGAVSSCNILDMF